MDGSIMAALRDGTTELHGAAERQPFQRALVRGEMSREAYGAYLAQMLHVHSALETRLAACRDDRVGRVVTPDQSQRANLSADLGVLGAGSSPLPAAVALADRIAAEASDAAALGHLYVLEGSKNGNAYVARAVRRALALSPGTGDRYLDPHGESQRPVWAAFKERMNAERWTEAEAAAMLEAARTMFGGVAQMAAELETIRERGPKAEVTVRTIGIPLGR